MAAWGYRPEVDSSHRCSHPKEHRPIHLNRRRWVLPGVAIRPIHQLRPLVARPALNLPSHRRRQRVARRALNLPSHQLRPRVARSVLSRPIHQLRLWVARPVLNRPSRCRPPEERPNRRYLRPGESPNRHFLPREVYLST